MDKMHLPYGLILGMVTTKYTGRGLRTVEKPGAKILWYMPHRIKQSVSVASRQL